VPAEVVVVGCGMTTPVGLSGPETAASARSRTARMTEIQWRDDRFKPYTVAVVPDDGLGELDPGLARPPLSYREARMLRLAEAPLQEALAGLPGRRPQVPLFLGLPELHTTVPIQGEAFLARLARQARADLNLGASVAVPNGRAAALLALRQAWERLSADKESFALVGGVDSYLDLYVLGTLNRRRRVRTAVNADGFIPGEGAGFVLLATAPSARAHGLAPLGRVVACAAGKEPGHLGAEEPYKGEGLAETFAALFAAAKAPPAGCVYASFNGERYWAKEFGVALLRNKERFAPDYQMEHPAECFGDLGAAHGAVLLGLACLGVRGGYRRAPALVYSSSDYGDRAATLIAAAA
jgi:3-oxoacyl-[acyl-carrier-protein] synthase-1